MKIKEERENIREKATAPNWRSVINTGRGGMEKLLR
jgi:hypothetical protein